MATENPEEGEANNSRLHSFFSSILTSIGGVFSSNQDYQEEEEAMASNESVAALPVQLQNRGLSFFNFHF